MLGIAGSFSAKRAATNDLITLQIHTADGLILPSRMLQIHWMKISEYPQHASVSPHPNPPPQGGREHTETAAPLSPK